MHLWWLTLSAPNTAMQGIKQYQANAVVTDSYTHGPLTWSIVHTHLAATPPCRLRILFVVGPLQPHHSFNHNCQLLLSNNDSHIFCWVNPEGQ
jgi:hypothetical protein